MSEVLLERFGEGRGGDSTGTSIAEGFPDISFERTERTEKKERVHKEVLSCVAERGLRELYQNRERFEMEMEKTRTNLLDFIQKELSRNAEMCGDLREFFGSELANNDLECLTLIRFYGDFYRPDLYREELYRHSLGVFCVAAEAYASVLSIRAGGGEAALDLEDRLSSEVGGKSLKETRREFLRASLIHDLGKISIPEFVVYNPITDRQSFEVLKENPSSAETESILLRFSNEPGFPVSVASEGGEGANKKINFSLEERERIFSWLEGRRVNPRMPVGILVAMDENNKLPQEERLKKLQEMGIDPKARFEDVLNGHERQSGILIGLIENDSILKGLAESHHNKEHVIRYLVASVSSGNEVLHNWLLEHHISHEQVSDVPPADIGPSFLHISDVWEAIRAKRAYKDPLPLDQSLAILVSETIREELNPKVAAFFIDFQIGKYFGGETSDDHWRSWNTSDASPKFKTMVEDFLIREKVWVRS